MKYHYTIIRMINLKKKPLHELLARIWRHQDFIKHWRSCEIGIHFRGFPSGSVVKKVKVKVKSLSRVRLFATPWTVAYQAPPSMEFSRQEYWSGLPFPSPGDLPDSGIRPRSAFQADVLLGYSLICFNLHEFFSPVVSTEHLG